MTLLAAILEFSPERLLEPGVITGIVLMVVGLIAVLGSGIIADMLPKKEENPDLIILDVMMPKINGYKIARLLKYDNKYKHIPIIMVTARGQDSDKLIGEETGADEYITKPFEFEEVLKSVRKHLEA